MQKHRRHGDLAELQIEPQPKKVASIKSLEEVVDLFWIEKLESIEAGKGDVITVAKTGR